MGREPTRQEVIDIAKPNREPWTADRGPATGTAAPGLGLQRHRSKPERSQDALIVSESCFQAMSPTWGMVVVGVSATSTSTVKVPATVG